jgi:heme-degrading monooxygenase HmoA
MAYYHLTIHHPKEGKTDALAESMQRFGNAIRNAPGLISVHTLKDERNGALIGMAVWESIEAMQASIHLARAAVANDPFDEWEEGDVQGYLAKDI